MKELPTGVQGFAMLRREDKLYVDKTARLLEMIRMGRRIFLSRPRRFGKSLTVSTLEAMFGGRAEPQGSRSRRRGGRRGPEGHVLPAGLTPCVPCAGRRPAAASFLCAVSCRSLVRGRGPTVPAASA
ncbi:MAG: AAA family ATPase [Desulfovibrio sp.]|nr:AAA family ATPase [Desulfovibrio sp.]